MRGGQMELGAAVRISWGRGGKIWREGNSGTSKIAYWGVEQKDKRYQEKERKREWKRTRRRGGGSR